MGLSFLLPVLQPMPTFTDLQNGLSVTTLLQLSISSQKETIFRDGNVTRALDHGIHWFLPHALSPRTRWLNVERPVGDSRYSNSWEVVPCKVGCLPTGRSECLNPAYGTTSPITRSRWSGTQGMEVGRAPLTIAPNDCGKKSCFLFDLGLAA